jgi:hypothetical protein
MRKGFVLFAGLVLLSMLAACSDDSTPTPPAPHVVDFEITTAAVPVAYTCSPYNTTLVVQGGTAPYVWTLADGSDPLPEGIVLTADGAISGVMTAAGDFSFTVRVTDSSPTPKTYDKAFDMNVDVPSNPSLAVFFDGTASVCQSATTAWTPVNCYVFIMLDETVNCAQATEFKLRIADIDNVDLDPGSQYAITSVTIPEHVAVTLGDLFAGMAIAFNRPMYAMDGPVLVASFDMLLLEDLQNLSFKFEANPNGSLGIASCDVGNPIVNVTGREAAINY